MEFIAHIRAPRQSTLCNPRPRKTWCRPMRFRAHIQSGELLLPHAYPKWGGTCLGRYVNPGNDGFASIVADEYVGKTGLLTLFDSTLSKKRNLVMVSRPRRDSGRPALLFELKWNRPVSAAAEQALARNYPQVLCGLGVPILVVAVTYDTRTKEHACRIAEA